MKKLLAILILTLIPLSANSVELDVKEIQITPTNSTCQFGKSQFAQGEFLVEFTGKPDLAIRGIRPTVRLLFNNWYHLIYDMNCDDTILAFVSLKQIEGVDKVNYNFIMKIMK